MFLKTRLQNYANKKAKVVTHHKVFVTVSDDLCFRGADIGPLHSKTDPRYDAWEIRIDRGFLAENISNPGKMRKIICHELAHIIVPSDDHPCQFERVARRLGASRYSKTGVG